MNVKKALVVDDSPINGKVAQKMLEKFDISVKVVLSGKECLEIIKSESFDVIFMDIMMPQMDGIETFKKLKELDGFDTPTVTLTADDQSRTKEEYLTLGFYDFIQKPINIEILQKVLERI